MRKERVVYSISLILLTTLWISCGGGTSGSGTSGGGPPQVAVTISPTSASLPNYINGSSTAQKFTATVSNATNQAVTWEVNGIKGGNSTYGTIDSSGNYVPPRLVPSGSITVTAVAQADPSKTASAPVKVSYGRPAVNAAWQITAPFGGSTIQQLRADVSNPILYALSWNDGLGTYWKGTVGQSGAVQWAKPIGTSKDVFCMSDIWANGNTIYALDCMGNFYRSADAGKTWKNSAVSGVSIAADPTGQNIFVGSGNGIYKSSDGGATWSQSSTTGGAPVVVDPRQPGAAYVYAMSGNGVEYTIDGGQTWNESSPLYPCDIAIDPLSSTELYVLANCNFMPVIYHGDPIYGWGGMIYTAFLSANTLTTDSAGNVYVNGYQPYVKNDFLWVSTDGGKSFAPIDNGLPYATYPTHVVSLGNGNLFIGIPGIGVFGTTNGGVTWSFQSSGMTAWQGSTVAASGNCIYFSEFNDNVFISCDAGKTWSGSPGPPASQIAVDPFDGSNLAEATFGGPLYYSTDGGNTFQYNTSLPDEWSTSGVAFDPSQKGLVYLDAYIWQWPFVNPIQSGVLYSTSGPGGVFQNCSDAGFPSANIPTSLAINPANPKEMFIGVINQGIYRSTDACSSWSKVYATVWPASFSFDTKAKPPLIYASVNGGSVVSTDDGETWQPTPLGDNIIADPSAAGSAFSTGYATTSQGSPGCWSPDGGLDCLQELSLATSGDVLVGFNGLLPFPSGVYEALPFPAMAIVQSEPEQVCATSPVVGLVCAVVGP